LNFFFLYKELLVFLFKYINISTLLLPGATLATYHFHQLKTLKQNYSKNTMEDVRISPLNAHEEGLLYLLFYQSYLIITIILVCLQSWSKGVIYAECQNLARTLMELPANIVFIYEKEGTQLTWFLAHSLLFL
jgi:hypothetical protein